MNHKRSYRSRRIREEFIHKVLIADPSKAPTVKVAQVIQLSEAPERLLPGISDHHFAAVESLGVLPRRIGFDPSHSQDR
jgi:hypothetical protein